MYTRAHPVQIVRNRNVHQRLPAQRLYREESGLFFSSHTRTHRFAMQPARHIALPECGGWEEGRCGNGNYHRPRSFLAVSVSSFLAGHSRKWRLPHHEGPWHVTQLEDDLGSQEKPGEAGRPAGCAGAVTAWGGWPSTGAGPCCASGWPATGEGAAPARPWGQQPAGGAPCPSARPGRKAAARHFR